ACAASSRFRASSVSRTSLVDAPSVAVSAISPSLAMLEDATREVARAIGRSAHIFFTWSHHCQCGKAGFVLFARRTSEDPQPPPPEAAGAPSEAGQLRPEAVPARSGPPARAGRRP